MNANATETRNLGTPPTRNAPVPEPPEGVFDTATPDELQSRLDLFRERYLLGLMAPAEFNELLLEFQFGDAEGRTWSPGVNSRDWYVWRDGVWQRAMPPNSLRIRNSTLWVLFEGQQTDRSDPADRIDQANQTDRSDRTDLPGDIRRTGQTGQTSPTVPTPAIESVIPVPPPPGPGRNQDDLPARPPVDPSRPAYCPGCGQPAGYAKFCTKCGRQIAASNRA